PDLVEVLRHREQGLAIPASQCHAIDHVGRTVYVGLDEGTDGGRPGLARRHAASLLGLVYVGILRHLAGPKALLELGVYVFVPKTATPFTLTRLGVGVLSFEFFQELSCLGFEILCHGTYMPDED